MLEFCHKLQPKPKTVPEFKDALQLIWSALPEKAIDNAAKHHSKRLQACVPAKVTFWKFNVIIHTTDTNCSIQLNVIWRDLPSYET